MKDKICQILGNNIKKIRKSKKITQSELAEKIGIEVKSLSLVETGKGFMSSKTLEKLSFILNTPVKNFFEEPNSNDSDTLYREIVDNLNIIKSDSLKLNTVNLVIKSLL